MYKMNLFKKKIVNEDVKNLRHIDKLLSYKKSQIKIELLIINGVVRILPCNEQEISFIKNQIKIDFEKIENINNFQKDLKKIIKEIKLQRKNNDPDIVTDTKKTISNIKQSVNLILIDNFFINNEINDN